MTGDVIGSQVSSPPRRMGTGSKLEPGPHSASWRTAAGVIPLDRPCVVGILNVTPDSFWDGGHFADASAALRHGERLVSEGADVIDVGGESTRPGAATVPADEEIRRVAPVVRSLAREWPGLPISVDTVKSAVAAAALDEGAAIINDVSGFRLDPDLAPLCAERGAGVVLMHSRGGVEDMARYETAVYGDDAVAEMVAELAAAADRARQAGVPEDAIVLDPGLGFSKRTAASVAVLRELHRVRALGYPVLIGPSRKRFIGELAGGLPPDERLPGTIAACVAGWIAGARLFRVHDVAPVRHALLVARHLAD
jgi:dihydropteroate synthase